MSAVGQKVAGTCSYEDDDREAVDRVITQRFSSRAFSKRPVSKGTMEEIFDVARFAPSGANIQPWRVYVLAGEDKDRISSAILKAHHEAPDQHRSGYQYYAPQLPEPYLSRREQFGSLYYASLGIDRSDQEARARQTAKNYSFFGAPIGLIITIDRRLATGSWLDLGMFLQNVMIAAGARGLQSCPQETLSKYHLVLRQHLPITDEEIVVCGISLGYAESPNAGGLMPKAEVGEFATFVGFEA